MLTNPGLLRINVGFVVNQAIGYSRDFIIEIPDLSFSDDLVIENLVGKIVVSRTTEGLLVQVNGQARTGVDCVYCLRKIRTNPPA